MTTSHYVTRERHRQTQHHPIAPSTASFSRTRWAAFPTRIPADDLDTLQEQSCSKKEVSDLKRLRQLSDTNLPMQLQQAMTSPMSGSLLRFTYDS